VYDFILSFHQVAHRVHKYIKSIYIKEEGTVRRSLIGSSRTLYVNMVGHQHENGQGTVSIAAF